LDHLQCQICITYDTGKAYELADAVAWCHNKDQKIDGCRILNLVDELRVQMERDLLI